MITEQIFKRGSDGKIRSWQVEVNGADHRVIAGIHGGKMVESKWKTAKPKNVGKANATTPEQQAALEASAEEAKKLKREYRRTIPELEFVPNGPMLAETWDDFKKEVPYADGVWSQPKLDGIRAMMTRKWGATSREYQPHYNCGHLMAAIEPLFAAEDGIEFDGELYNHLYKDAFSSLTSIIRKQKATPEQASRAAELIQYHIYDLPSPAPFAERTEKLKELLAKIGHPQLIYVPTTKVGNLEELDAAEVEAVELGYEGQMVRFNEAYQYDSRPWSLMKRKRFVTEEFPILRVEEGEGNWSGVAKRVVLQMPDGQECGSGMRGTQEFAAELLAQCRAGKTPKVGTVRHFGFTPDGMLRFPVVTDFHQDGRVD
ncbi:ATP-dependent DNA ligase [Bradyrhizobium elkanii]|uniref:ATP-dependent DNA ligase n=1 Tax=Bradyrhizobium elkanii TaxID=29448 RepID=UPI002714E278|nr:hypothetical protein [Bradyrhizobium elkanii]WLB04152.1 hypothetical protein QNJ80_20065 [Bradyrhizobium elkanii]